MVLFLGLGSISEDRTVACRGCVIKQEELMSRLELIGYDDLFKGGKGP